jgi:dihydroorotate dehydrogenase
VNEFAHTPNLRALQDKEPSIVAKQNKNLAKPKQKPILLKLSRFDDEQLLDIIDIVKETKLQVL